MVEEVLLELPHIQLVRVDSGAYCLIVEDTQLNDYVEDFLWDDYEYQSTEVAIKEEANLAIYYNYFPADFPIEDVVDSLKEIDVNEVERVFQLNNQ
jgi:hypothetical protein